VIIREMNGMPLSCCALLFHLLLDSFRRHLAGGGDKVPGPHRGHSAEMGIHLAEATGRVPFQTAHTLVRREVRRSVHKQIDMMRHDLEGEDIKIDLLCLFLKRSFQGLLDLSPEGPSAFASVSRRSDNAGETQRRELV